MKTNSFVIVGIPLGILIVGFGIYQYATKRWPFRDGDNSPVVVADSTQSVSVLDSAKATVPDEIHIRHKTKFQDQTDNQNKKNGHKVRDDGYVVCSVSSTAQGTIPVLVNWRLVLNDGIITLSGADNQQSIIVKPESDKEGKDSSLYAEAYKYPLLKATLYDSAHPNGLLMYEATSGTPQNGDSVTINYSKSCK